VSDSEKRRISFPLRLSASLRDHAKALAKEDGVSLNHFINLALAEKITRLEIAMVRRIPPSVKCGSEIKSSRSDGQRL
jgi:hypothetical protein